MTASVLRLLFLLALAVNAVVGAARGLNKALIRVVTIVPAVILPFYLAVPAAVRMADSIRIEDQALGEWLLSLLQSTDLGAMFRESPLLQESIMALPAFLIAIFMLPVVFLLLRFLTWILYCLIRNPLRRWVFREDLTEEQETGIAAKMGVGRRLGGMGLGLVTGVVVFGVMMAPLFGLFTMLPEAKSVKNTMEVMVEHELISAETSRDIQGVYSVTDCATVKFYQMIGGTAVGRTYMNAAAEISADGETVYLTDELETLLDVVQIALGGGLGDPSATPARLADNAFVKSLMQKLFDSRLLRAAVPGAMSAVMENIALGMEVPEDKAAQIARSVYKAMSKAVSKEVAVTETADTLADIVSDFAGVVDSASDENGEMDAANMDFAGLADATTRLQNSELKELGSALLDMLASGEPGNNDLVRDLLYTVKEHYDNGDDISGITGTAGALIGLVSSMEEEEADRDKQVRAVNGLINNLNAETVDILLSVLSEDTIAAMGVPEAYAKSACSVVETLLLELSKLEGEEDYENEVNSILLLFKLVGSNGEGIGREDIDDLAHCAMASDAIYTTLMSISHSDPFGIEIADKELRRDLASDIDSAYAQSGKTNREREIYRAIAALLGMDKEVHLR